MMNQFSQKCYSPLPMVDDLQVDIIKFTTGSKDEIFCFPCRHFSANIIASGKTAGNLCFVNYGSKCKIWKEQTLSLNNHQRCKTHVICVQRWNDYLLVKKNHSLSIANQVNNVRQQNIIENREHLKFLLKAALFLSKQGLAFREHNESDISKNKGNFLEILDMFADDKIKLRLQARTVTTLVLSIKMIL